MHILACAGREKLVKKKKQRKVYKSVKPLADDRLRTDPNIILAKHTYPANHTLGTLESPSRYVFSFGSVRFLLRRMISPFNPITAVRLHPKFRDKLLRS